MATLVAFHAHPDDEALLTGGTLACAAARGHRVVVVVAADGLMGAVPEQGEAPRLAELRASARVLGVARVVHLGYADSGHGAVLYPDPPDRARFVRADPAEAAARLAAILREERADVLLGYDASGGYGHRDHVRVHEVGRLAAELAAVRLLEATMPRERVLRAVRVIRALRVPFAYDDAALQNAYTPRSQITHMVDARGFARQKRDALARHRSQLARGRLAPLARMLVKTPAPLIALLAGYEWYTEVQVPQGRDQKPESDRTEGSATMSDVFKSAA